MLVHIVVVYVPGNVGKQFSAYLICFFVEYDDVDRHVVIKQKFADGIDSNSKRLILRIAVNPR